MQCPIKSKSGTDSFCFCLAYRGSCLACSVAVTSCAVLLCVTFVFVFHLVAWNMTWLVWGYSSVVEHSTADREVPGSNPGVPWFFDLGYLLVYKYTATINATLTWCWVCAKLLYIHSQSNCVSFNSLYVTMVYLCYTCSSWKKDRNRRSHGVMVSTLDFESSDPSSNLGETSPNFSVQLIV